MVAQSPTRFDKEKSLMRTALVALVFAVFVTAASAADLFTGTWKSVPAKSKNNW